MEEEKVLQTFLDLIAPTAVKFAVDHYVMGNTWRCVWAIRKYPTTTEEQALLQRLGEKAGVSLHIYTRRVSSIGMVSIFSFQNDIFFPRVVCYHLTRYFVTIYTI